MPIYEYRCEKCHLVHEEIRTFEGRDLAAWCYCGSHESGYRCERVASVPALAIWNSERKFPNVTPTGDGSMSFDSKSDYESHLKVRHMVELRVDGKIKTPHSAKVKVYR